MNNRFTQIIATLLLSICLLPNASASGAGGGGAGSTYSTNRLPPRQDDQLRTPQRQRQVDQVYETGKAIFLGRQAGVEKLSYCVKVDGELKPIKRKSVKKFKKTTYNELAQNMFNCDQPETKIATQLSRDDFLYVVYYLNKRHRLKLSS